MTTDYLPSEQWSLDEVDRAQQDLLYMGVTLAMHHMLKRAVCDQRLDATARIVFVVAIEVANKHNGAIEELNRHDVAHALRQRLGIDVSEKTISNKIDMLRRHGYLASRRVVGARKNVREYQVAGIPARNLTDRLKAISDHIANDLASRYRGNPNDLASLHGGNSPDLASRYGGNPSGSLPAMEGSHRYSGNPNPENGSSLPAMEGSQNLRGHIYIESPSIEEEVKEERLSEDTDTDSQSDKRKKQKIDKIPDLPTSRFPQGRTWKEHWEFPVEWMRETFETYRGQGSEIEFKREIVAQSKKFVDHWLSVTGQKGRKKDWHATWRQWCSNGYGLKWTRRRPEEIPRDLATMAEEKPKQDDWDLGTTI